MRHPSPPLMAEISWRKLMNSDLPSTPTPEQMMSLLRKLNHDLRNPLNVLTATTSMLDEGMCDPLTAKQTRAVQRLDRNLQRMIVMLDHFIWTLKADAGEYPLTIADFDPRQLLNTVKTECQPTAEAKNIALSVVISESVPASLRGDAAVIQEMVLALVWNAISFTPQGTVQIESQWAGGWQITVKDSGPGVPGAAVPYLFDLFWRGDTVGSIVPTAGSGLGLAVVRAFARLMKGQLSLKETNERGSVFSLFLPDAR